MALTFGTNAPPSALTVNNNVTRAIRANAQTWSIPEDIALALAWRERDPKKGLDPKVRGGDGEYGLFQIMPNTARGLGVKGDLSVLFDPHINAYYGLKHLRAMITKFQTMPRALSAYNAGSPWRVDNRGYVNDILATSQRLKRAQLWGQARKVATVGGIAMMAWFAYKEISS